MASVRPPYRASRVHRGLLRTVGWARSSVVAIPAFTLPLNFQLVSSTSYLLQSCHCLFISGCQCVSVRGDDVTKRLTGAALPITPEKLVNCICFCSITIDTEVRQFRQSYSPPLRACFMATPSVCSMCSNHIIAFLLYWLLQVYPPVRIRPIVSGFKTLRRNNLLHANAIVRDSKKPRYFRFAQIHDEKHNRLVLEP